VGPTYRPSHTILHIVAISRTESSTIVTVALSVWVQLRLLPFPMWVDSQISLQAVMRRDPNLFNTLSVNSTRLLKSVCSRRVQRLFEIGYEIC